MPEDNERIYAPTDHPVTKLLLDMWGPPLPGEEGLTDYAIVARCRALAGSLTTFLEGLREIDPNTPLLPPMPKPGDEVHVKLYSGQTPDVAIKIVGEEAAEGMNRPSEIRMGRVCACAEGGCRNPVTSPSEKLCSDCVMEGCSVRRH